MQLTINFEAGLTDSYPTCREYVAARIHQIGKTQKAIAADMDMSPSHLSRKVSQNPDDSMRLTLDDFERYIEVTGDKKPVLYLVEKYLTEGDEAALLRQIESLQTQLAARKRK